MDITGSTVPFTIRRGSASKKELMLFPGIWRCVMCSGTRYNIHVALWVMSASESYFVISKWAHSKLSNHVKECVGFFKHTLFCIEECGKFFRGLQGAVRDWFLRDGIFCSRPLIQVLPLLTISSFPTVKKTGLISPVIRRGNILSLKRSQAHFFEAI